MAQEILAPRSANLHLREAFNHDAWKRLPETGLWQVPLSNPRDEDTWRAFSEQLCLLAEHGEDLGFVLSAIAHAGLLRALLTHGTEPQRSRWLPRLTGGEIACTALTEPRGGSDVSGTTTSARRDGSAYRLTGFKDHITNGPVADFGLVLGRLEGLPERRDITLFLVDLRRPGVTHGDHESLMGLRTSPTGSLRFDDVLVDGDCVLGRPGEGLATLYDIISYDRLLYGLVAAASLKPRLRDALRHCQEREAFGSPIADHQYVQGRLTDITLAIRTAEAVSWDAHERLFTAAPDAAMACSMAKLIGSTRLVESAQDLLCLHGHLGYLRGPTTRFVQDALGTLIAGGTSEMQRKNIFSQLVLSEGAV